MILRIIRDYLPGRRERSAPRDVLQERYALCGLAELGRAHRHRYLAVSGTGGLMGRPAGWAGLDSGVSRDVVTRVSRYAVARVNRDAVARVSRYAVARVGRMQLRE